MHDPKLQARPPLSAFALGVGPRWLRQLTIDARRVLLMDAPLFFLLLQNTRLLRAKVLHLLALSGIGGHFAARVVLHGSI
ncbi:MAG: hypothetical protein WBO09_16300, partial [Methylocystis silviterrae]